MGGLFFYMSHPEFCNNLKTRLVILYFLGIHDISLRCLLLARTPTTAKALSFRLKMLDNQGFNGRFPLLASSPTTNKATEVKMIGGQQQTSERNIMNT